MADMEITVLGHGLPIGTLNELGSIVGHALGTTTKWGSPEPILGTKDRAIIASLMLIHEDLRALNSAIRDGFESVVEGA